MSLRGLLWLVLSVPFTVGAATVRADVGNCTVMFSFVPGGGLTVDQQQKLGQRLLNAHSASGESDSHILLICEFSAGSEDKAILYSIRETGLTGVSNFKPVGYLYRGYRLTARDYEHLVMAVEEFEMAANENSFWGLEAGPRKEKPKAPIYRKKLQ